MCTVVALVRALQVAMVLSGQDAWRRHPMLSQCAKTPFPAIRPAIAIFLGLVAVDWAYGKIAGRSKHALSLCTNLSRVYPHLLMPVTYCM